MQACPNCNYANRPGVVFCENCGTSLIGSSAVVETRSLAEHDPAKPDGETSISLKSLEDHRFQSGEEFPSQGALQVEINAESATPIILLANKALMFGRRDAATGSIPDVDLTPYAGYRMGVSRRHAEIQPDKDGPYLNLWDLGSSNGTFINGERLTSHRPYRLRDGDLVSFGQLGAKIRFRKTRDGVKEVQEDT